MADLNTPLKSQLTSATLWIILVKLSLGVAKFNFPFGLLLILAWNYPVQSAYNRSANSAVVLRCSRMQGMSSLHAVLAGGMTCAFHDKDIRAALYPMWVRYEPHGEKQEKLRLWSIGLTENKKKNTRRPRAKIVKQKKNARRPRTKLKNVKRTLVVHGRRRIF